MEDMMNLWYAGLAILSVMLLALALSLFTAKDTVQIMDKKE